MRTTKSKKFCKACTHNEIYHQWVCGDGTLVWGACTRTGCTCKEFTLVRPKKADKKTKEDKI